MFSFYLLYIGHILLRNVVFQVMPDSVLYMAPIKFSMHIIIGFPVIKQLKEIHIYKNGRMNIPLEPSKSLFHNLALDGLDPVIALKTDSTILPFYFDSGAGTSDYYYNYFKRYKTKVLRQGHLKKVHFGGAGGIIEREVYVLPVVNMYLGNKKIAIDSVNVLTQELSPSEKFYGNIGQDLMSQFEEMTLNFKYMYVDAQ